MKSHYISTLWHEQTPCHSHKDIQAILELRRELGVLVSGEVDDSKSLTGWSYTLTAPRELSAEEQEMLYLSPINYNGDIG